MKTDPAPTTKIYFSLGRVLLLWFLLLALAPLSISAWLGYQQATESLTEAATQELEQDAKESTRFLQNWFDSRFLDLSSQAESRRNIELMELLHDAFAESGLDAKAFVNSNDWLEITNGHQSDLVKLTQRYDYILDVYMLDEKGNILFSVARQDDLGTSLFNGPYSGTRFAKTVQNVLLNREYLFSDLEYFGPNKDLSGFLITSLFNSLGERQGLFAIQLDIEWINSLLLGNVKKETMTHYLVGEDGVLRTPLELGRETDVLTMSIDTPQIDLWRLEHGDNGVGEDSEEEPVFYYVGPREAEVIGIHQTLRLPGVAWALISEIDKDIALNTAYRLGDITFVTFIITVITVVTASFYLSRRITDPLIQLADASMAASEGQARQHVEIKADNEIGLLARAINHLVSTRNEYERKIEQSNLEASKALARLEEQKFAMDQHAIVASTDAGGTITFVNEKFTEISGYSKQELLGSNHRIVNSGYHDAAFFKEMYATISSGNVWKGEICNRAKDGHLYWVDTTIVPFMDGNGQVESYIAIRTDISKRKQTQEELIHAKEAAEAATRQKSDFLANMSHEIRTPMNGIIGMGGLLLDTELTQRQRSYAEAAMNSADALLVIINDILDFSKIEAGKLELEEVVFDLQCLAEDVAELMALKCREKNLEMLLRYKPGSERLVIGDPGRVRQVLLNLLSNAVKFTEEGYILLSIESYDVVEGMVSFNVSVSDTGVGIAEDKLDHVFNKFDQEDTSTTRKYGGTGLGLTICRQLTSMMGGDVSVESKKEEGSVFTFSMMLKRAPGTPYDFNSLEDYGQLRGLKTLIVDDMEIARTVMLEQLAPYEMRLESVASGKAALQAIEDAIANDDPFDIVITDFHMGGMDGETLARLITERKLHEDGVMVFVTSSPRKGDGARLKELGFDGYLTKPTYPSEIPQIISLAWSAKQQGKDIPLVTRHTLQEVKVGGRKKTSFNNASILLVEDNPINVMVATELLAGYGCIVTPAGNGREAFALVRQRDFDLVFMDCQMPVMDGFEATERIRKYHTAGNKERVPIIAFTANAMKEDKTRCLNVGMDDYLSKPVNQDSLEEKLSKWLPNKIIQVGSMEDESENDQLIHSTELNRELSHVLNLDTFNGLGELFGEKFPALVEQHTQAALENINKVAEAIEKSDLEVMERSAHSVKGASGQFGALRLHEIAKQMEALAKEGDLEAGKELLDDFQAAQKEAAEVMLQQLT